MQLPLLGCQRTGGKAAVIGRKRHRNGGPLRLGGLPVVGLVHSGIIHPQLRGIARKLRYDSQRVIVGHRAQQNAVVKGLGVQLGGAAGNGKLVAGAVVHGKARASHRQHGAGVAGLHRKHLDAVGRVDDGVAAAQLHKAARQFLDLHGVADAGVDRPAAVGTVQIERGTVHRVCQQGDGRRQRAGKPRQKQRQYDNYHRDERHTAALALLEQRLQRFYVFLRGLLPGGGGGAAADGFGRAQTDVPAGAGYGIGRGTLLARQHTLAAFLTFPVGFVHGAAPPFV